MFCSKDPFWGDPKGSRSSPGLYKETILVVLTNLLVSAGTLCNYSWPQCWRSGSMFCCHVYVPDRGPRDVVFSVTYLLGWMTQLWFSLWSDSLFKGSFQWFFSSQLHHGPWSSVSLYIASSLMQSHFFFFIFVNSVKFSMSCGTLKEEIFYTTADIKHVSVFLWL